MNVPVTVRIPTILRHHVGGEAAVHGEGGTVGDLLDDLETRYPGLKRGIVGDDGGLHRFVNVYVNDEDVRYIGALDAQVSEGDTVSILPAVAGGAERLRPQSSGAAVRTTPLYSGLVATT